MRSIGNDIVELFGYAPDDLSRKSAKAFEEKTCPFVGTTCTKMNHDQSVVYGTCSVTAPGHGKQRREIIICPKRLYADNHKVLKDAAHKVWPNIPLIAGGNNAELKKKALNQDEVAVAFGQNSGREVSVNSNGKMSMDWVIQRYTAKDGNLQPHDYIGIEVQSIDITGNYRDNWKSYSSLRQGEEITEVAPSRHGLNWANVHKRLIPQIIRKGNIYSGTENCSGFFFIVPELVYEKFDELLGDMDEQPEPSSRSLTILSYEIGSRVEFGAIRSLELVRCRNHKLVDVAQAFISRTGTSSSRELDRIMSKLL